MNMNAMKNNRSKTFALVAAFAMIVCAFALIMPAADAAEAETQLPAVSDGVYSLTAAQYGTEETPISMSKTDGNVGFELSGVESSVVYLSFQASEGDLNLFSEGTLTVDGAITIYITVSGKDTTTARALYNMDVTLTGGATLVLKSAEGVASQIWWNTDTENPKTLTLGTEGNATDSGKLVLDSAGGFSSVNANLYGKSSVVAQNTEVAAMNFSNLNVDSGASVEIADGTETYINFVGEVNNSGRIDAGESTINLAPTATLNNAKTGKVSASEITGDGTVENDGGKIDAKVSSSVAYPDRDITSNITLGDNAKIDKDSAVIASSNQGIIIDGDVTIVDGGYFTVNGKLTINEGASLTIQKGGYVNIGSTGVVDIQGDLIIEAGTGTSSGDYTGNSFDYKGCGMNVSGSVTLEGANSFNSEGTGVVISGLFEVGESATASFKGAEITETGELTILGAVKEGSTVTNNGTITVDSRESPTLREIILKPLST